MDKLNNESQQAGAAEEATPSPAKPKGVVAKFLAWIARGAEKAQKDGSLCSK